MRIGASYGESCRYCGSTEIIVEPASSSGHCALCSHEAAAWTARADGTVDRYAAAARSDAAAIAADARHTAEAARTAARRSATALKAAQARSAIFQWLRFAPLRARTSA